MAKRPPKSKVADWAHRLECPIDPNANYHNTFWCNRDLIPIPSSRRTWTWQGYAGYWVIAGINTTAWTSGSSLLALGLSVPQAMGVMVGVALISAIIAVLAGWPGSHEYLGFTVLCRASWGMRGGFWPVLNRIVTAIVWLGIQMYWVGQAVKIILGAIVGRRWVELRNTLPQSANVDTASLIGFFVFLVIFMPCLMVPPERLQMPFRITFVMITCTMFGMLGWAIATNNGPANAALIGQLIMAPLTICLTAVCGLLITSATAEIYGVYLWNPFELLLHIQKTSLSPATHAGTFFAGLGFLCSQLALCIVLNCVSAGMDLAALCPKWINIRRGGYFVSVIAIAICPWNYVTKPTTFITVLSGWSVFLSPMTGIVIADYFLVRKRGYHVGDLYTGNSSSAYWGTAGFNWRGFAAWTMGIWPVLPGFARSVQGTAAGSGWDHIYQMTYFYGFFAALAVYWALHTAFPQPRQTGCSPFVLQEHARMLGGDERTFSGGSETVIVEASKGEA
ncbi:hypothetical protein CBER1_08794 [Cercospora berteroae]|uniref:Uracil permease n=1 Tax=Cercospora berteroae TaxID=357750 RepID=A0A2S6BWR3_9PEZI|nr:hypothetical protein CBER1_08794 [Cercospora berteroae]